VPKNESADLEARIVAAIGLAGPRNVAQISRMTHAHQETIRYKVKKRFGRLGFKFHAEVDYDRLGLSLHWATLNFSKAYYGMAPQILRTMNQVGYLTYYAKLVPQGNHIALFALPENTAGQYREFLSDLGSKGILDGHTLDGVLASRHKAMDPRFFNFRAGRWEIEWNELAELPPSPLPRKSEKHPEDFDYYDLLIIKELQKDSLQHLTGVAKKLKVHQKTLEYHYRTHVQKWKLIPSYRIRWSQDTAKRPIHSTVMVHLSFSNLTKTEFSEVQAAISKVPLLWMEYEMENGTYIAMLYVPVTDLMSVSSYINDAVPNLASKLNMSLVKYAEANAFTIPYHMFQDGAWKSNLREMEKALQKESTVRAQK
jgi:DNA-binding Lrp family transcriptional regulator